VKLDRIRNFSIIAHIDHGKSTLADRLLEVCGITTAQNARAQILDNMELERERGITIKSQTVRLPYTAGNTNKYILNLIDTPGHIDFNYEVSRSLSACEGVLLLIDASQGIEAQTIANYQLAESAQLTVIPVLNKIDLPNIDIPAIEDQIENILAIPREQVIPVSAKTGENCDLILEAIVQEIPPPHGDPNAPLQALIIDSSYNSYRGAIIKARIFNGTIKTNDAITLMATHKKFEVSEVGVYDLDLIPTQSLAAGEVGYIIAGIKNVSDTKIGDTITHTRQACEQPLPGFKDIKPMVWAGVYPVDGNDYQALADALEKLKLNDSSLQSQGDTSNALGFGFRCGFLGLLHMEIIQERLEREFNLELITTAPNVTYRIYTEQHKVLEIHTPTDWPTETKILKTEEPYIKGIIISPVEFIGNIMKLCQENRGEHQRTEYLSPTRVELEYILPFAEIFYDFNDKLKSGSRGYASFDYEFIGMRESKLSRLDILINGKSVDALSVICHHDSAYHRGRQIVHKLRKLIPRQLYEVPLQAAIGAKIIARETIKALRKNVTAKCYGGDITRKRKLLEKQKEGKRRMKKVGNIDIPQTAFMAILSTKDGSDE